MAKERFHSEQAIEPGAKTDEPIRRRGWTHWNHLFTPRQLLVNGLLAEKTAAMPLSQAARVGLTLGVGRCADYNWRLCRWHTRTIGDKSEQTFSNQALNTLFNFAVRTLPALNANWFARITDAPVAGKTAVAVCDGRSVVRNCDLWVTDPPYADAVNYDETLGLRMQRSWSVHAGIDSTNPALVGFVYLR